MLVLLKEVSLRYPIASVSYGMVFDTNFHDDRFRHSSNISIYINSFICCSVGISDRNDLWSMPLRWPHVAWYQVSWRLVKEFRYCYEGDTHRDRHTQQGQTVSLLLVLAYFPYFEEIKGSLWDHIAVCLSVYAPPNFCDEAYETTVLPIFPFPVRSVSYQTIVCD
jgi:hypothetical protein